MKDLDDNDDAAYISEIQTAGILLAQQGVRTSLSKLIKCLPTSYPGLSWLPINHIITIIGDNHDSIMVIMVFIHRSTFFLAFNDNWQRINTLLKLNSYLPSAVDTACLLFRFFCYQFKRI